MKVISSLTLLGLITSLFIFSCSKKDEVIKETSKDHDIQHKLNSENPFLDYHEPFDQWYENNSSRIDSIDWFELTNGLDNTTQRLIFSSTSNYNKFKIVKEKYNQLIIHGNFNSGQFKLVQDVFDFVTPELYEGLTQTNHIAVQEFKIRAQEIFNDGETYMILADLDNIYVGAAAEIDACGCSTDSDWCDFPVVAGGCTGGCNYSSSGCGTLFLYTCDGDCELGVSANNWDPWMY